MNTRRVIFTLILVASAFNGSAFSQGMKLGDNAALRYWAAFAQMQDSAITDEEATKLNGILSGPVPYDDLKYKDLVERNRPALDTMAGGTVFANCDWGLDYHRGPDTPVEYVRKSLELGRLNVLYAFHLQIAGDKDGAVRALAAGIRFSRDVANGGPLFAALAAKDLLTTHFKAVGFLLHMSGLSAPQRAILQKAVAQLGPVGVDWKSATRRDLESLRCSVSQDSHASAALDQISSAYIRTLNDPSTLPALQKLIAGAPQTVAQAIPNPKRVLEQKQELKDQLSQIRSLLQ
jgi:hypothetical protein